MKRYWALALPLVLVSCGGGHTPLPRVEALGIANTAELVSRGEYIVRTVAVCGHCHAADPKEPDGPLRGGFAFKDWRLGTVRAANLTPDSLTGLGAWSDAEIMRAVRNGEDREGDVIPPVMSYEWFHEMSDADALAVARYLKSLDPMMNRVESNTNLVYKAAKLFMLKPIDDAIPPAPPRGATVEYGRYLANHVALCADCHTPRGGIRNAPDRDRLFAGNSKPPKGFPENPANLTPDSATGIGRWTEEQFVNTLKTGTNPQGLPLNPFMPWRQFRRMSDDDLRAIYRYLRTIKPIRNEIPDREG